MAGGVVTLIVLVSSLSYPSVIFTGELEIYSGVGIGMGLISAVILGLALAIGSSYPGSVGVPQVEPAIVLAVVAAGAVSALDGAAPEQILPTLIAMVMLSSALIGLTFLMLGSLNLGNLVRYIPYPVKAGALAGIGCLMVSGTLSVLTGQRLTFESALEIVHPDLLARWTPALGCALLLCVLQRRHAHALNIPGALLGSIALFWLTAWLHGVPLEQLRADGWLLRPIPQQEVLSPTAHFAALEHADWTFLAGESPRLATAVLIALVTLLMTAGSIEIAAKRDVDFNRELRATGVGNCLCALAGSLPGYHSIGGSILTHRMGAPVRLAGLMAATISGLVLYFGSTGLSYLPKILIGTLIFYAAIDLIIETLIDARRRMSRSDYAVLLLVFGGIVFAGLTEGIALGIVAGIVLFAVHYSRISVVRRALTGADTRSNVERPSEIRSVLVRNGEAILVLQLQGYVFFGTSHALLGHIVERLNDGSRLPLRFVVLDCRHVTGVDSAAMDSIAKLLQQAAARDFDVIVSASPRDIRRPLRAG